MMDKRKRRRKDSGSSWSDLSFGASATVPSQVSKWTENDLNGLSISYAGNSENPHDILNQAELVCKIEKIPREICDAIKFLDECLDFDIATTEKGEIDVDALYIDERGHDIVKMLDKKYDDINLSKYTSSPSSLSLTVLEKFAFIRRFIRQLRRLVHFHLRKELVYEQGYTDLLISFGLICGLDGESGNVVKRIIKIGDEIVTSQPDIRFRSTDLSLETAECETVVSIAEIKQAHGDYELIPEVTTRSKSGTPDTAASMSSFKIHSYLKSGILGRHGGELLADWKYAVSNPYIIGMIVCGSKVIITSLMLSHKDLIFGINMNGKMDKMKTVRYSEPLDIFKKEDRKILYEIFFRLSETKKKPDSTQCVK